MTASIDLQQLWQLNDEKIENNKQLNILLLKKVNSTEAKNKLSSLVWLSALTLVFYLAVDIIMINFLIEQGDKLHFSLAGVVILLWSSTIAFGALRQLKAILSIDYTTAIVDVQKQLLDIKLISLFYIKWALMIIPFNLAFILVGSEMLFSHDLFSQGMPEWVKTHLIINLVLLIPTIIFYRSLSPKNINQSWLKALLNGNGSQIDEALKLFKEIEEIERS